MKSNQISSLISKLYSWRTGDVSLYEIDDLLGAKHQTVYNLFYSNDLCDGSAKAREDVAFQHILDCLIMYLAMRKEL